MTTARTPRGDENIWDTDTRAARTELTTLITDEHPTVTDARVTCNQAPLQVQGTFTDGRIFLFHARYGRAELQIAVPDQHTPPRDDIAVDCSDTLSVDDTTAAAALFATLLNAHPDHP